MSPRSQLLRCGFRICGQRQGSIEAAPFINPSVASQGEMRTRLTQMTPSADAIDQTECDASRAMARPEFVTGVAFTHVATLTRASG